MNEARNDLDHRLTSAMHDATATVVSDDAFAEIVARADGARTRRRAWRPAIVLGATLSVALAAFGFSQLDLAGDPGTSTAAIGMTVSGEDSPTCAAVTSRQASADEAAVVAYLPETVPDGFELVDGGTLAAAFLQTRPLSEAECWDASVTYVHPSSAALLTARVLPAGGPAPASCEPAAMSAPLSCTQVQGQSGWVTDRGAATEIAWTTPDGISVYLSGFGLDADELIDVAETVSFDGVDVTLAAPSEMVLADAQPKTADDGREVTYWSATYRPVGAGQSETGGVGVSVTTWDSISVNEVGPGQLTDIRGTQAIVVSRGAPGLGIVYWMGGPAGVEAIEITGGAYVTWSSGGRTFRVEGPDADTVIAFARALVPAQL